MFKVTIEEWFNANTGSIVNEAKKAYKMNDFPNNIDRKDLYQEVCIAVIKAWNNFDKNKGEFFPYALSYIKNRFIELNPNIYYKDGEIRENSYHTNTTIIADEFTPSDNDNKLIKKDVLVTIYRGIKEQLDDRSYQIITSYYGLFDSDEKTLKEIGNDLDYTKERIRQLKDKAEESLKTWLDDHGIGKEMLNYETFK